MPVDGAQLHAQAHLGKLKASPHLVNRQDQGHQAAQQVQPVQPGEQIKEGVGWVGRQVVACGVQLLPRKELPDQECQGEEAIRPYPTSSIRPLRAATCAYCSATLLKISTPVLNHSTSGAGICAQSATCIRMK